jgi:hypothetical protein
LAGIWESYLAFGLLWVANRSEESILQALRERAPSWSWAAFDGQVSYYWPLSRIQEESLLAPQLNLVSHHINVTGLDHMGEVMGGAFDSFWIHQESLVASTSFKKIRSVYHIE